MIPYKSDSFFSVLFRLRGSVLKNVWAHLLFSALVSILSVYIWKWYGFTTGTGAHSIMGIALSFLLVFRSNISYSRYWEGRSALGIMSKASRQLARQAATLLQRGEHEEMNLELEREELMRHVCLCNFLVVQHLRTERDISKLPMELWREEEEDELIKEKNRPVKVLAWISSRMASWANSGLLTEQRLMLMDHQLGEYTTAFSVVDKISTTPFPFPYAQLVKLAVVVFVYTCAFALNDELLWFTPVAVVFLALVYFGIDAVGMELEDPFGLDDNDLDMIGFMNGIRGDAEMLMRWDGSVPKVKSVTVRRRKGVERMETEKTSLITPINYTE